MAVLALVGFAGAGVAQFSAAQPSNISKGDMDGAISIYETFSAITRKRNQVDWCCALNRFCRFV
jgi:hypothetical protein